MKKTPLAVVLLAAVMLVGAVLAIGAYVPPLAYQWSMLLAQQCASIIYAVDANTTIFAYAEPGAATTRRADPVWQIRKVTGTGSAYPNVTTTTWANGTNAFTNRVGANYESMLAANYE